MINWFEGMKHGHAGRWSAFMPMPSSRKINFYILRRSHDTDARAVVKLDDKGKQVMEPVKEYGVKFELTECIEGEFPEHPTLSLGSFGDREFYDFVQCIMNFGASIGMLPANQKDQTDELKAVRYHLEDMRKIVLKDATP